MSHTAPTAPFWFYIIQELAKARWKNSEINCKWRTEIFLDRQISFVNRKSRDECSAPL